MRDSELKLGHMLAMSFVAVFLRLRSPEWYRKPDFFTITLINSSLIKLQIGEYCIQVICEIWGGKVCSNFWYIVTTLQFEGEHEDKDRLGSKGNIVFDLNIIVNCELCIGRGQIKSIETAEQGTYLDLLLHSYSSDKLYNQSSFILCLFYLGQKTHPNQSSVIYLQCPYKSTSLIASPFVLSESRAMLLYWGRLDRSSDCHMTWSVVSIVLLTTKSTSHVIDRRLGRRIL